MLKWRGSLMTTILNLRILYSWRARNRHFTIWDLKISNLVPGDADRRGLLRTFVQSLNGGHRGSEVRYGASYRGRASLLCVLDVFDRRGRLRKETAGHEKARAPWAAAVAEQGFQPLPPAVFPTRPRITRRVTDTDAGSPGRGLLSRQS